MLEWDMDIVKDYLKRLEDGKHVIVGYYQQGSEVFGLSDRFSDKDVIVIWQDSIPDTAERMSIVESLGAEPHDFRDIPVVKKSMDAFVYNGEVYNLAHILAEDFFAFYSRLTNFGEYYDETFIRLGGFQESKILYDPQGRLVEYKDEIVISPEIKNKFYKYIREKLGQKLKKLQTSSQRKGAALYLRYLYEVVEIMRIIVALENEEFPGSIKWLESRNDNDLTNILNLIEGSIDKDEITEKILSLAKTYGFTPSNKIKA